MPHATNTKDFVAAISVCGSPLLKVYCGLVAIELTLKSSVGLSNHDVPSALNRLNITDPKPNGPKLSGLAQRLKNEIGSIYVTNANGVKQFAPANSYPYIRYTTFDTDGWAAPNTTKFKMTALASTVSEIRKHLKLHYGFEL